MADPKRCSRVLMVEDEAGDARLLQLAMQHNGFALEIHHVRDGYEALCYLRHAEPPWQSCVRPDLILLDLKMPRLGGLEFLALIKQDEDLRAIPVVAVSSSVCDADVSSAYDLGVAGYMLKPADLQEFVTMVRTLGEYWFRLVRLPHND